MLLGALTCLDGEVRSCHRADEERVAGQECPVDQEAAVLGAMPRGVEAAHPHGSDRHLVAVGQRVVRIARSGVAVDRDRNPVLQREPAVPRDMVGVCVSLEHTHDPDAEPLGLREIGLDRVGGVDEQRLAGLLVPDEIGRAAQVRVDELPEDHRARTLAAAAAVFLEVTGAGAQPSGRPRCFAITMRCTSFVPSPISRIFWSR